VYVAGADELERWIAARRHEFADDHATALEELARAAEAVGDWTSAVNRWRRRQAAEPLRSRVAVALMRALQISGDGPAALRYARVHEALVKQEFGSSADASVAETAAAILGDVRARDSAAVQIAARLHESGTGTVDTLAVSAEDATGVATLTRDTPLVADESVAPRSIARNGRWRRRRAGPLLARRIRTRVRTFLSCDADRSRLRRCGRVADGGRRGHRALRHR